ncbi:(2Fe-2S) ferredoxin domain-containing protein [Anaerolentibacter hominis]|uniref:(2Fe-2S) ferredoxin domain-containing protein n=1 Tax=Anaerolentibacter hominis TaxID=3079009 RepID=UPI0031B84C04
MIITICIGSSCHVKGSRKIVEQMGELIKTHNLDKKIELNGSFCMGECVKGVCVKVDGELFSLSPDNTEQFFNDVILGRL